MTTNKTVGENKLEKLVRLMKRYEGQLQNTTENGVSINITLESDGSGGLFSSETDSEFGFQNRVYVFPNTDKLFEFLESGELKRTLMVRG